jgi:hypothetical protein
MRCLEMNRPMNAEPFPKPARQWANVLVIAIFFSLLWLPTLDKCFNLDRSRPPGENRLPAPFPQLQQPSLAAAQKFITGLEAYFNDHFGFRKKLIRLFQNWKLGLFHDRSVYKIVVGQDHWLFWGEAQMVEHFLGLAKFTPGQLQLWQKLLEKRRDWLAQRGIKYLFVVAPDKQSVYPEELPAWLINAVPANRETKLDQFLQYMQTHSTVEILDLRRPLIDAKKIAPVYLQNDTHWNLLGSFVAAQELVKVLAQQFTNLPPLQLQDFTWTNMAYTGGDMARMLGTDAVEKNYFAFNPKPALPRLRSQENLNYPTAWGLKRILTLENPEAASTTVVLFTDSFGVSWEQFLGYPFKKTIFLADNREFNPKIISENKPAIVVNEMLERYFYTTDPEELMGRDGLP